MNPQHIFPHNIPPPPLDMDESPYPNPTTILGGDGSNHGLVGMETPPMPPLQLGNHQHRYGFTDHTYYGSYAPGDLPELPDDSPQRSGLAPIWSTAEHSGGGGGHNHHFLPMDNFPHQDLPPQPSQAFPSSHHHKQHWQHPAAPSLEYPSRAPTPFSHDENDNNHNNNNTGNSNDNGNRGDPSLDYYGSQHLPLGNHPTDVTTWKETTSWHSPHHPSHNDQYQHTTHAHNNNDTHANIYSTYNMYSQNQHQEDDTNSTLGANPHAQQYSRHDQQQHQQHSQQQLGNHYNNHHNSYMTPHGTYDNRFDQNVQNSGKNDQNNNTNNNDQNNQHNNMSYGDVYDQHDITDYNTTNGDHGTHHSRDNNNNNNNNDNHVDHVDDHHNNIPPSDNNEPHNDLNNYQPEDETQIPPPTPIIFVEQPKFAAAQESLTHSFEAKAKHAKHGTAYSAFPQHAQAMAKVNAQRVNTRGDFPSIRRLTQLLRCHGYYSHEGIITSPEGGQSDDTDSTSDDSSGDGSGVGNRGDGVKNDGEASPPPDAAAITAARHQKKLLRRAEDAREDASIAQHDVLHYPHYTLYSAAPIHAFAWSLTTPHLSAVATAKLSWPNQVFINQYNPAAQCIETVFTFDTPYPITAIQFSPDYQHTGHGYKEMFALVSDCVRLFSYNPLARPEGGQLSHLASFTHSDIVEHAAPYTSLDWSTFDRACLATGCVDGTIQFWDSELLCHRSGVVAHQGKVNHVEFSRHEEYLLLSVGDDGMLKLHDVRDLESGLELFGTSRRNLNSETNRVRDRFSLRGERDAAEVLSKVAQNYIDEKYLALTCAERTKAYIYDIRLPNEPVVEIQGHGVGAITGLHWMPDCPTQLMTSGEDGRLLLWDLNNITLQDSFHPNDATHVHEHTGIDIVELTQHPEDYVKLKMEQKRLARQKLRLQNVTPSARTDRINNTGDDDDDDDYHWNYKEDNADDGDESDVGHDDNHNKNNNSHHKQHPTYHEKHAQYQLRPLYCAPTTFGPNLQHYFFQLPNGKRVQCPMNCIFHPKMRRALYQEHCAGQKANELFELQQFLLERRKARLSMIIQNSNGCGGSGEGEQQQQQQEQQPQNVQKEPHIIHTNENTIFKYQPPIPPPPIESTASILFLKSLRSGKQPLPLHTQVEEQLMQANDSIDNNNDNYNIVQINEQYTQQLQQLSNPHGEQPHQEQHEEQQQQLVNHPEHNTFDPHHHDPTTTTYAQVDVHFENQHNNNNLNKLKTTHNPTTHYNKRKHYQALYNEFMQMEYDLQRCLQCKRKQQEYLDNQHNQQQQQQQNNPCFDHLPTLLCHTHHKQFFGLVETAEAQQDQIDKDEQQSTQPSTKHHHINYTSQSLERTKLFYAGRYNRLITALPTEEVRQGDLPWWLYEILALERAPFFLPKPVETARQQFKEVMWMKEKRPVAINQFDISPFASNLVGYTTDFGLEIIKF